MSSVAVRRPDSRPEVSERILELQRKIYDASYVDGAIQRLAQVMSSRLVELQSHKEPWYVR